MRDDSADRSRAQSAVIGFVLMFGLIMLLMTILQVSAVPVWNQGEEFAHSQQVRDELELLREDVGQTAIRGSVSSESITLGMRYPRRPFLLNPTDPAGRIETTAPGTVEITNLTASGEPGDYWTGEPRTFRTRHVVYRPDYNEYDNAPTTVLENSVLYDRYPDTVFPLTTETVVSDRRITLVTLNGSLSEASVAAEDVELQPISAPQQVTSVEGEGPVRLRLPTRLPAETWESLLEDEFVANGGNVYDNVTVAAGDPYDTVTITLRGDRTYNLRMAKVGVGDDLARVDPHYITVDSPPRLSVPAGSTERVVYEVRDRLNNPVSGVRVNATATGGSVAPVDATTDADGRAVFRYTAGAAGNATVEATFGDAPGALETAAVDVSVAAPTGADTGGPVVTTVTTDSTGASGGSVPRGTTLTLSATATDFQRGGTDIYAVEWWSNRTNPGGSAGTGATLGPADGEFDAVEETAAAAVDTSSWDTGVHELSVRGRDANGNWGPVTTYRLRVTNGTERPLLTAVGADPDLLADSDGEFVRVQVPAGVDTTGWTLEDNAGSVTVADDIDGEVYFARDPDAFAAQWPGVDRAATRSIGTVQLNNGGETVELVDASGTVVDRFAYGGADTFADGSSYSFSPTTGAVAVRRGGPATFVDTHSASDWTQQPECAFFGGGAGCGGDTTAPSLSAFALSASGDTLSVTLDTTEPLGADGGDLTVDLSGPDPTTLARADFTETANGDGTYTYTATYTAGATGTYTATLTAARDAAGNDGASGQSDSATVAATYDIRSVSTAAGGGNDIDVTVDVDAPGGAQLTVQSLRNGNVRDATTAAVAASQPQTVTVQGRNQAGSVRVILTDSAGTERDRRTVSYP